MKKLNKICLMIFGCALALSIIFWFTQIRKGDRIGPSIRMNSSEMTVELHASDDEFLKGVRAKDAKDGDVSDTLVVESVSNFLSGGRRIAVIAAVDKHNNVSRANRTIIYKGYKSPKFSMKKPLCFPTTSSNDFDMLQNLKVSDSIDGDISDQTRVMTNSTVDLYSAGEYPVKFQVANSAGDTISLNATIIVYDKEDEADHAFIHLDKYLVYTKAGKKLKPESYISKVSTGGNYERSDVAGDISKSKVKIDDSDVNYNKAGSYEIKYTVSSGGHKGSVNLIVIVEE
ncbi:MAG: DUF5011 domain-containing protein [Anaerostipes sp.]|nr:DUF5011 domain-containing protein [Anaerostipes sp.]